MAWYDIAWHAKQLCNLHITRSWDKPPWPTDIISQIETAIHEIENENELECRSFDDGVICSDVTRRTHRELSAT